MDGLTKEQVAADYKNYPDVMPDGIQSYSEARILPILCEIPENARVLDVGCNSGEFMRLLQSRKACQISGVDVSEALIEKAKTKGLDVFVADAESLPFPDETFDVVTLMEVLVHVHDPNKALREIKRVLKPNGFLLGSAPHANLERYLWDDKRLHHRYYDELSIQVELNRVFDKSWVRIIKGGQFAIGFAGSFLATEPVELLFKSGNLDTPPWEHGLYSSDRLRVWMGFTQPPGTVYYRMKGFADKMRDMGAEIAYEDFDSKDDTAPGRWQTKIFPGARLVVNELETLLKVAHLSVWQVTHSRYVLAFLRAAKDMLKRPIITEVDDWLFDLPSYNIASGPYQPNSEMEWVAMKQIELSDAITCSTQFIKDGLTQLFPGKPIYILRNSLDFDLYDNLKPNPLIHKEAGRIRIGYTGCGNHGGDLETVRRPLMAVLDEFPNTEFIVSGAMRSGSDGKPFMIEHPRAYALNAWATIEAYPNAVAGWQMDIGLAPLRDNNFNRAKSNLRWLEYSALKIPTVASKVYPFKNSIRDGADGLIATSEEQWYEALKSLITDPGRRTQIGATAYDRVKRDYNMTDVAREYKTILEEIKQSWTEALSKPKSAVS